MCLKQNEFWYPSGSQQVEGVLEDLLLLLGQFLRIEVATPGGSEQGEGFHDTLLSHLGQFLTGLRLPRPSNWRHSQRSG